MKKETVRPANFSYNVSGISPLTEIIKRNDLMLCMIEELTEKLEKFRYLTNVEKIDNNITDLIVLLEYESKEYIKSSKEEFSNIKNIERHG